MAYGQTGSGKTYTMFGSDWTLNSNENDYIDNMLADANITMTPVLESIINCAITLTCYFMPHNRDEE